MADPTPTPPPAPRPKTTVGGLVTAMAVVVYVAFALVNHYRPVNPPTPPAPPPAPAVVVRGPATATVGQQVVLDATAPAGSLVRWTPPPGGFHVDTSGLRAYFTPVSPGDVTVAAMALSIQNGAIVSIDGSCAIVVAGPPPPPGPPPVPPGPPPAPVVPHATPPLHVTLIYDDAAKTPAVAAIQASPTIGAAVAAVGRSVYRSFAAGDPTAAKAGLDSIAAAYGLPCVIVQDAAGAVVAKFPLPPNEAALMVAIKATAGVKL